MEATDESLQEKKSDSQQCRDTYRDPERNLDCDQFFPGRNPFTGQRFQTGTHTETLTLIDGSHYVSSSQIS